VLTHLSEIKIKRKIIQERRTVDDKALLVKLGNKLDFEVMNNIVIEKIVNPIFVGYHYLLMKLL
jgi:hypothetical protein